MTRSRELAELATAYDTGTPLGFRNRIINGDMRISQRLGASSLLCSNITDYTLDRWVVVSNPQSKLTVQQDAGGVTPPVGFSDYLGVTVTTAETITSGDFYNLVQFIEGYNISDLAWGSASAKPVTVSFWVRSSVTGTYSFAFRNNGETRSYVTTYTINSANTWEQKTIVIPGDTSGTWNVTNGRGIEVVFDFGRAGETSTSNAWTASGNVRLAGTVKLVENASATFYITGVQLEAGSVATPFERRPFGTELALCQRYYQKSFPQATAPVNNSGFAYVQTTLKYGSANAEPQVQIVFPVAMRAAPSATLYNPFTGTAAQWTDGLSVSAHARALNMSEFGIQIDNTDTTLNWNSAASINYAVTAEL
jgi:hypothetical protein